MNVAIARDSKKFSLATLGCKVNQYESAAIIKALERAGLVYVPFKSQADFYLINTCTVTASTDYQSRQLIRRAIRQNPHADVIVTGCYAEVGAENIKGIPGVTMIVGNKDKDTLVEKILGTEKMGSTGNSTWPYYFPPPSLLPGRTRAILKIQDGCESFCHYCIVPYARGPIRSLPPWAVIERLMEMSRAGLQEVTLTGVNLGAYGQDLMPRYTLEDLLTDICRLPIRFRIRLSSIEPLEVSERLISLMARHPFLCPHLHLPLQCGDDELLAKMNRNYNQKYIRDLINEINLSCPDIAIGMDIIVGLPGETVDAFARTYAFLEELPIAYLHIFPFSRRPGTPAATFPGQVSEEEKRKRSLALRMLDQKKRRDFMARFIHRPIEVIVEQKRDKKTGLIKGISSHYLPVALKRLSEQDANTVKTVIPLEIKEGIILAEEIS
ncbi:MAG: tRNA (N(6)-L-threonylcarbamoyladenosine(37)-C(2))-methylthiotransferase MtaB [Syntrophales bacterium]|nr:tRNA (N(6)-L-threonylcarbamoyladenosine(37)-C(2))-methylthiotransferase MtaB [Syntrophales bacterium]